MKTYAITLKCGDDTFETEGQTGACGTSPRDLQHLAAIVWGAGAEFEVHAPSVGLFLRDVARA